MTANFPTESNCQYSVVCGFNTHWPMLTSHSGRYILNNSYNFTVTLNRDGFFVSAQE